MRHHSSLDRNSLDRNSLNRRRFIGFTAAACLACVPAFAEDASDPAKFVGEIAQRGIVEVLNANIPNAEKQQRFRTLFKQDFDIPAIGRFVLGRYSRTVSAQDLQQFQNAFEDVIVYTWSRRFSEYNGQTLKVSGSEPDGQDGALVKSTVTGKGGNAFEVDWRLRKRAEGYRVVDVVVEGVSMAITYRQEYTSIIGQSGFPGLLQRLQTQIGDLKKQLQA
jgi:phospholipid transport system substrate-binding protein